MIQFTFTLEFELMSLTAPGMCRQSPKSLRFSRLSKMGCAIRIFLRILKDSGIGLPEYYKWRSRSGCYFCFFQQRREWVGLLANHKDLFDKAAEFEKNDPETGESFTWVQGESLSDISNPDRVAAIKKEYEKRMSRSSHDVTNRDAPLLDVFSDDENGENQGGCLICHL